MLEYPKTIHFKMIYSLTGILMMTKLYFEDKIWSHMTVQSLQVQIRHYTFFLEGEGNPPGLMGIDDDQLLSMKHYL